MACIEESLNFAEHGVANTISMLVIDCPSSHWHIARLPPNSAKRCWTMQANIGTLCNAKVGTDKHGTHALMYKGLKKKYEFLFCLDNIKHCVSGNKKKSVCYTSL